MKPKKDQFQPQAATPEQLQARLEIRRSNASGAMKNKKAYSRKSKYPRGEE
jgi:hypothetical protein